MNLPRESAELFLTAKALVEAVGHDDAGAMVGGKAQGGNGGLLSNATLLKADACRKAIARYEQMITGSAK